MVYGFAGHPPNCYVDISSTIGKKVEAVLQFETTMSIITDLFGLELNKKSSTKDDKKLMKSTDEWIRARVEETGKHAGLKAAEAFYIQKCLPGHFDNLHPSTEVYKGKRDESPQIY